MLTALAMAIPLIAAAPPKLLDGDWTGTETCVEHCCSGKPGHEYCQGSVAAHLSLADGNGTYSIGSCAVLAEEFRGDFASGHVAGKADRKPHGTFILQANATHAWGSWISFGTKRLFHWNFERAPPPPPPPPPCSASKSAAACAAAKAGCVWSAAGACESKILAQVDVFVGHTAGSWGTTYFCFRVPSAVRMPSGEIVVFVESRIGSCGDQAPKDVTMKVSTDGGAQTPQPPSPPPPTHTPPPPTRPPRARAPAPPPPGRRFFCLCLMRRRVQGGPGGR